MKKRSLVVTKPSGDSVLAHAVNEELNEWGVTRQMRDEVAWPLRFMYQSDGMEGLRSELAHSFGIVVLAHGSRTLVVKSTEGRKDRAALIFVLGLKAERAEAVLIGCCGEEEARKEPMLARFALRARLVEEFYFDQAGDRE